MYIHPPGNSITLYNIITPSWLGMYIWFSHMFLQCIFLYVLLITTIKGTFKMLFCYGFHSCVCTWMISSSMGIVIIFPTDCSITVRTDHLRLPMPFVIRRLTKCSLAYCTLYILFIVICERSCRRWSTCRMWYTTSTLRGCGTLASWSSCNRGCGTHDRWVRGGGALDSWTSVNFGHKGGRMSCSARGRRFGGTLFLPHILGFVL